MPTIYLDVCCLNRPFDDQSQPRVHLEAEALLIVFAHIRSGEWKWVSSTVVDLEVDQTIDLTRKSRTKLLLSATHHTVSVQSAEEGRAKELVTLGIPAMDALHVACAENGGANVLLTTDDRLLHRATRLAAHLRVRVENPLTWVRELSEK
jgi:predicted nucleic acid-binding protein